MKVEARRLESIALKTNHESRITNHEAKNE